ncbi:hypothetical protein E3Q17_02141 [Wallemia mellicola]|uniref:PLP-dependent transferase n=1 Tax=Wallemia mellicola TaxID=1708541 RepID=A0A4T0NSS6_9BASI|nr:hypothetical protein E3Q17_02141 [Wallemia mellicola]
MPHLYRHFRVNQVFGANTDVGKTLLTTALLLAESRRTANNIYYLKPVSTGPDAEQDDAFLQRFSTTDRIKHHTLYRYSDPVSPHLAVSRESVEKKPPSDKEFARSIGDYITNTAALPNTHSLYVETAGGVHSPTLTGTSQADAYRPLLLPTILVASSHLGGISTTLAAYESLHIRGYNIDTILVFKEEYYANYQYLTEWAQERGIHVATIDQPPSRDSNAFNDEKALSAYFNSLSTNDESPVVKALEELDRRHQARIDEVEGLPDRTLKSIWYPFAQHSHITSSSQIGVIDSAHADNFDVYRPNRDSTSLLKQEFDGSASWWTQTLGHGNPTLALAAAHAAGRYGHILFPGHTHKPVLELCERLLEGPGKGWANKAFVTDNGSTAMEVALKIALRAASKKYGRTQRGVIGLSGSYHGDTIGSMDASEPSVYNNAVEWYSPRGGFWFDAPLIKYKSGKVILKGAVAMGVPENAVVNGDYWEIAISDSLSDAYNLDKRIKSDLSTLYRDFVQQTLIKLVGEGRQFGALVLEPLIMGAGGMLSVDPLFQRVLIDTVRANEKLFAEQAGEAYTEGQEWEGLPVVFDEVFVGLYRLGQLTPVSILGTAPDVSAYAKILSGGVVPLSTTLARQSMFDNFLGEEKKEALLHGHSYTAHPIGCSVANASFEEIKKLTTSDDWKASKSAWNSESENAIWSLWNPETVKTLASLDNVDGVLALGTVLVVHLKSSGKGYESGGGQRFLATLANEDADYTSALAANRDEWLSRPTKPAGMHRFGSEDKEEVISGIDLLMEGTWIGANKSGKIAALTNYFEPLPKDGKLLKSRGKIPKDCLQSGRTIEEDLEEIAKIKDEVGPFNLLLIQVNKGSVRYGYATNRSLTSNFHGMFTEQIGGMSNGYVDANNDIASQSEWHKVKHAKEHLNRVIKEDMSDRELIDALEASISHEVHPMQTREDFQYSARIPPIIMRPAANPIALNETNKEDVQAIYATRLLTMATPVEQILRNARAKPLTNEEVNNVIVPVSQYLFEKGRENDQNQPNWFNDKYDGDGTLTEATAFLIRLFAYSPPKEELLIYKKHLTFQLFSNPKTVYDWQLCKLQARHVYLRNFKADKLNKFFALVHQWEVEAYSEHLKAAMSPLITLDNLDQSLYHISMLNPDIFFRKEVMSVVIQKLEGSSGFVEYLPPPPTILALTASVDDTVNKWANRMIDDYEWRPVTKENAKMYLILIENILQRIVDRENGNLESDDEWPFKEDTTALWTTLGKTLSVMEPSAIEVISRSSPNLLRDVQRHLCDAKTKNYIPLLRCFVALISVRQGYWSEDSHKASQMNKSDEHSVLLLRLMNSILDNPFYKPLMKEPIKFHKNDDEEWPLNWWSNLIKNVENVHELHDSALKSLSRRGFESTKDGDVNIKYKYYNNIISIFEKCFVDYENNERKLQLLFDVLRIYNTNLLETALTAQMGDPTKDQSIYAARRLLQLCMKKDCIRIIRGLNDFMSKFASWKDYERQVKRKKSAKEPDVTLDTKKIIIASDIWESIYKVIGVTNNIDDIFAWSLLLSNISLISHLRPLNEKTYDESAVPTHMKSTMATFKTSFNNAINTIQSPFQRTVDDYLHESASSNRLQALSNLVESTATKWHKYFDNSFMVKWMRDSISLAGVLLDSEKDLERHITSTPSKMLDPLNKILIQSVGWLKATDMTVLEFTFRFIDSTLTAFKQSGCLPAPQALDKLSDYSRQASQGSVKKLSHLSLSKLKQHLATFNDESDDDDVQIIEKKPGLAKLNRVLTSEKKPSPAQFLEAKKKDDEAKEKLKQMALNKHSLVKKTTGKPLLTGLTAKKDQARKPYVAPQKLTYGGNKKEESESSEEEVDRGGLKDMDLDPEQAKLKMQAVKDKRSGVRALDPLVGSSTKSVVSKADKQRDESFLRRQRLDPDIGDLQKYLLNVDYNDPKMRIGSEAPIERIPSDFKDYKHYYDIMRPLLFDETSEQLKQARAAAQEEENVTVVVAGKTFVNDYAEIVLNVKCEAPYQFSLSDSELITLTKIDSITPGGQRIGSLTQDHPSKDLIAKVQNFRRRGQDIIVTVWLPTLRSSVFQDKQHWKLSKFYSLNTLYREFGALKGLQHYGSILSKILKPEVKPKQNLDSILVKNTMRTLELNESQALAVLSSLIGPADGAFSLIQGPPGTGKSKTILALVAKFLSMRAKPLVGRTNPNAAENYVPPKILICAPSNAAIDEVVNRLKVPIRGTDGQIMEVNVIRIGADSSMSISAKERSLEELVDQRVNQDQSDQGSGTESSMQVNEFRDQLTACRNKINEIRNEINRKQQKKETVTPAETEELRKLSDKRNEISTKLDKARDNQKSTAKARDASRRTHRRAVMMEADVVCSTLSGAGKGDLAELPVEFETVIIDEAAQAVEVSALIPFKYGCKRPILIGDQHQLPPTVMSTEASKKGYSRSLFVRLMESNQGRVHLLNEQYRMHPDISKLPSAVFYNGHLKDGPMMAEKTKAPWHSNDLFGTYKFFDFAGGERRVDHSYQNPDEASVVISLYERLRKQYGGEFSLDYRVAIIATYKQQVRYIRNELKKRFWNVDKDILSKVDVNTVDGFQGQEKTIIILSTVRSTKFEDDGIYKERGGGPIGFLKDIRRMNVALTRAQSSLFIVGHADKLKYDQTWQHIVDDAEQRNLLQKINRNHFSQPSNFVATKLKHPTSQEKDAQNKKKNKTKEREQPPIPDNLVPTGNSPVKRKAEQESGASLAKKMKAAEDGRNGVTIKVVENDVVEEIESDIPGIGRMPSTQPLNAPSIESNSMDISSSNVSSNLPGGPNVMQNNNKSAEQQKQAIQEGYNKRKQEAKKNSMFMKKKPRK